MATEKCSLGHFCEGGDPTPVQCPAGALTASFSRAASSRLASRLTPRVASLRDKQIVDYACRQRQIRENAKATRPSIRRYDNEPSGDSYASFATLRPGGSFPSASVR